MGFVLMSDLDLYIEKQRLTQAQVAEFFGIVQSRVSDLVCGKWDKFGLERLITLEASLGRAVGVEQMVEWERPEPRLFLSVPTQLRGAWLVPSLRALTEHRP